MENTSTTQGQSFGQKVHQYNTGVRENVAVPKSFSGVSEENKFLSFVSKKTEKLMTAVYMLTDFLSDSEPMKPRLRELGLAILSDIHSLSHLVLSDRKNAARRALDGVESILSFLEIAASIELISRMNVDVLREEFTSLQELLRGRLFSPRENLAFSREFFALPEAAEAPDMPVAVPPPAPRTETPSARKELPSRPVSAPRFEEKKEPSTSFSQTSPHEHLPSVAAIREMNAEAAKESRLRKKDQMFSRRESILHIIKDNGEVTIGGVVARLPGVGEKTIQRELVALVQAGLLARRGERRWSKYSLR